MLNYFTKFAKKTFLLVAKWINNVFKPNKKNNELEKTIEYIVIKLNEITQELNKNFEIHKQSSAAIIKLNKGLTNCAELMNQHDQLINELKTYQNNYIYFDNNSKYSKHN